MTQPDQQQPTAGQRAAEAGGAAVAIAAMNAGLPDPFLPLRWLRLAAFSRAERKMMTRYRAAIGTWASGLAGRVTHGRVIDPHVILFASRQYDELARPAVEIVLKEIFEDGYRAAETEWDPEADTYLDRYLAGAWNRLSKVPDRVYEQVKAQVAKASHQGDDIDTLASRIEDLFVEHDIPTWQNRGLTVARTESIAAYNAGTFAGMVNSAKQDGGAWDKIWLATEDEKTRPTHARGTGADGQRVPLLTPFTVGGFPGMFPGDPTLPAAETVNCRCAPVMVRHGEEINMSNRQFRGAA